MTGRRRLRRRHGWAAPLAAAAFAAALVCDGNAAADPPTHAELHYRILRQGQELGSQRLTVRTENGMILVETESAVRVAVRGVDVYNFSQTTREAWRDGRLVWLDSVSHDNGAKRLVKIEPSAGKSLLVVDDKETEIATDVAPTTLWHVNMVKRVKHLVDTLWGHVRRFELSDQGEATVKLGTTDTRCRKYELTGEIRRQLCYAADGLLVRQAFVARDGLEVVVELVR